MASVGACYAVSHEIEDALKPGTPVAAVRFAAEALVDAISDTLVAVATGSRQPSYDHDEYRWAWRMSDLALGRLDIPNPNSYRDIWQFLDDRPTDDANEWHPRRLVRQMYDPVHERLTAMDRRRLARHVAEVATGWPTVDEKMESLRQQFAKADTADDWRDIGRRCDGLLESVGRAVTEALGDRLEIGATSPKDAGGIATLLSGVAQGLAHRKLRKLVSEASALAATAGPFLEATAAMLRQVGELGQATDSYANHVKHAARTEYQAAIAVESSIMFASITRHAVRLILSEDDDGS